MKQEASTRTGIHCVSMTRFITAGALHVSEALPDPESRGWTPFWLKRPLGPFHLRLLFKKQARVFICVLLKTTLAPSQSWLLVKQSPRLPVSAPALSIPQLHPGVGLLINRGNLCLSY